MTARLRQGKWDLAVCPQLLYTIRLSLTISDSSIQSPARYPLRHRATDWPSEYLSGSILNKSARCRAPVVSVHLPTRPPMYTSLFRNHSKHHTIINCVFRESFQPNVWQQNSAGFDYDTDQAARDRAIKAGLQLWAHGVDSFIRSSYGSVATSPGHRKYKRHQRAAQNGFLRNWSNLSLTNKGCNASLQHRWKDGELLVRWTSGYTVENYFSNSSLVLYWTTRDISKFRQRKFECLKAPYIYLLILFM